MLDQLDIVVVGAGVVGLAVAAEVSRRFPEQVSAVLERHARFGQETSSRNSEVIHAGMYYPAGTLKAKLCVEGNALLYDFCAKHNVPHQRLGKLIIAREEAEIPQIEAVYQQGIANGVADLVLLDRKQVARMEPHVRAVAAIWSPSTGIVDSHRLMAVLERQATDQGVMFCYRHEVIGVEQSERGYVVRYKGPDGAEDVIVCRWLINAAGLYADRIPAWLGIDVDGAKYRIWPVKGEYFSICPEKAHLVNRLVYPPPLKALKGLGTHLTKSLDGRARLGPNAFYVDRKDDFDVDPAHAVEFYEAARSYLPFLELQDLEPDMAGIRPKIQRPEDPVLDFVVCHEVQRGLPGLINLVGIESPGLTAALALGRMVADLIASGS
jgi:L-2-hydroxyglutarate oxidase LhgO